MAKVTWGGGVTAKGIDSVDTSKNFTPYAGPVPSPGVYQFHLKLLRRGVSTNNNPQMIVGLELFPRKGMPEQNKLKGYYLMEYITVTEGTQFRVRGFLDAIGVKGRDFTDRTVDDGSDKKNITKIGTWIQDGKQFLLVSIGWGTDQNGNQRMEVKGYVPKAGVAAVVEEEPEEPETEDTNADDEPPF